MIPGYRYKSMWITGFLHVVLGCIGLYLSIAGLSDADGSHNRNINLAPIFYICSLSCSIWILLVGCLGILAGMRNFKDQTIRGLKIAYMVTAILSASIFSVVGIGMFSLVSVGRPRELGLFISGIFFMFLEFVLAIVSASICCCCFSNTNTTTVLIPALPMQYQTPGMQPLYTVQYQTPEMQTSFGFQNQTSGMQAFYGVQGQPQDMKTSGFQNQTPDVQTSGDQNQAAGIQTFSEGENKSLNVQTLPGVQDQPQSMQAFSGIENQTPDVQTVSNDK